MRVGIIFLVLLVRDSNAISQPPVCMDYGDPLPYYDSNSTCGNGRLDSGEVCDDGNRIGGDGCNAWCNAFDRFSSACTMAGGMQTCSYNTPKLGSPSQSVFCDLTSVAARVRNGVTSLFLADAGVLLKYDIMVSPTRSIQPFASTAVVGSPYRRFCSLIPEADSDAVVAHECISQRVIRFASPTEVAGVQIIQDLGGVLAPSTTEHIVRDYYDEASRTLFIVSPPADSGAAAASICAVLYAVSLGSPAYDGRAVAYVPCSIDTPGDLTLDGFTGLPTTYDAGGMKPYMVFKEQCTDSLAMCYVVYMSRGDLHHVKVYVPAAVVNVTGSSPPLTFGMKYVVSTNAMDNVLFTGTIKKYTVGGALISLVSSCLSIQPPGGAPPITFGDACTLVKNSGWGCATPLRNPFPTDVVVSPFILPKQFSSGLTHHQLQRIFGTENLALANVSGMGGPFLYQQLLGNVLSGTLPVDIVEISSTGDLVYITPTSVNLITTKGVTLQDYTSFPYCLAHDATLCAAGYYGSVGGSCVRCPDTRSSSPTAAEQIMCVGQSSNNRRRLLTGGQMAPSVSFSVLVGGDVSGDEIDLSLCYYMNQNCIPCPTTPNQISQRQPTNGNADAALASQSIASTSVQSLPEKLMQTYATAVGMKLPDDGSEYSLTMAHPELNLMNSMIKNPSCTPTPLTSHFALANLNISALAFNAAASACSAQMYRGALRRMLRCLVQQIRTLTVPPLQAANRRRSLLGVDASSSIPATVPRIGQQNDVGIVSSTPVHFGSSSYGTYGGNTTSASDSSSSLSTLTIAIIAGASAAALLVVLTIIVCVSRRKNPSYAPLKQN